MLKVNPLLKLPMEFHFTQSNLQDFLDCERRFYLRYIAQQRWPSPLAEPQDEVETALQRGARFHQLLERQHVGIPLDVIYNSVEDDKILAEWLDNAQAILRDFGTFERHWVELALSTTVAERPVLAKFDFLGVQGDALIGIDWKTGTLPDIPTLQQRMQTIIYLLVMFRTGEALVGRTISSYQLCYVGVQDGTIRRFTVDSNSVHALVNQVGQTIRDVEAAREFPLTEDVQKCRFCIYRGLCERGTSPHLARVGTLAFDDLEELSLNLELGDSAPDEVEF